MRRSLPIVLTLGLLSLPPRPAAGAEEVRRGPYEATRHRAAVLALLAYGRPLPEATAETRSRARLEAFAERLAFDGGLLPEEAARALGVDAGPHRRVERLIEQLDRLRGGPVPPGGRDRPGALLLALPVALAYAAHPEDALRGAEAAATLAEDRLHAAATARVAAHVLLECLYGERDRRAIIHFAARASGDPGTGRAIRAARLGPFDQLRPEGDLLGDLQRALYLWCLSGSYGEAVRAGETHLAGWEARLLLAVLAAAYHGPRELPDPLVATFVRDQDRSGLADLLGRLASDGILIPVADGPAGPVPGALPSADRGAAPRAPEPPRLPAAPTAPAPPGTGFLYR
jgi:hypothetical protein